METKNLKLTLEQASENIDFVKKNFETQPVNDMSALERWVQSFIKNVDPGDAAGNNRKVPHSVWVDKRIIETVFLLKAVDGFRIIPIQYTERKEFPDGAVFKIGDVNFAILFTYAKPSGGHANETTVFFDYNNPCPKPPCP